MSSSRIPNASGIYKIVCAANKKLYIGSAVNLCTRRKGHFAALRHNRHRNPKLQRAWNKYGEQAFTFEVVEYVLPMSLTAREQYWLNKLKPFGQKGFNIASDATSRLGLTNSPEHRKRISNTLLGHTVSPEARRKMSEAKKGKSPSEAWRASASAAQKASPRTQEHLREMSEANSGRKRSPEAIEQSRQFHLDKKHRLGQKNSPEHCAKISQALLGHETSPETREKLRQASLHQKREASNA